MAELLLMCGKAAFAIMGFAVGLQFLRKSKSDEGLGIHSLATAVIFVGGLGLAGAALGEMIADASRGSAIALLIGGDLLERIALVGLCIFIWKVFRPDSPWGIGTALVLGLGLFASMAWELFRQPWPHYDASLQSAWSTQLTFALPLAWSAMEAMAEWARGRRKLALGLTTPAAVERFALWSIACLSFVAICILGVMVPILVEAEHADLAGPLVAVRAAFYFVITAAIWIGMFEPAFYLRRFQADPRPAHG